MNDLMLLHTALEVLRSDAAAHPLPTANVALPLVVGRVLRESVHNDLPWPHYTASHMDGFAVAVAVAEKPIPNSYEVIGSVRMGHPPELGLQPGQAMAVTTGGCVPEGTTAVVPVEWVRHEGGRIFVQQAIKPGQYLRVLGAERARNEEVFKPGHLITRSDLLLLAQCGIASAKVAARPRVWLVPTGRELVPHCERPRAGQVRNTTTLYLEHELASIADVTVLPTVLDDASHALQVLRRARDSGEADLVVTTGAVSMGGAADVLIDQAWPELEKEGARLLFHKLAVRPGKPTLVARLNERVSWVGLPGNALSSVVTFRHVLRPYLLALMGATEPAPAALPAILGAALDKPSGLRTFVAATLQIEGDRLVAYPDVHQSSFRLNGLSKQHGLAVNTAGRPGFLILPEACQHVAQGSLVMWSEQ